MLKNDDWPCPLCGCEDDHPLWNVFVSGPTNYECRFCGSIWEIKANGDYTVIVDNTDKVDPRALPSNK